MLLMVEALKAQLEEQTKLCKEQVCLCMHEIMAYFCWRATECDCFYPVAVLQMIQRIRYGTYHTG